MSEIEEFFSNLTPRIQADLPAWYGTDAKLVSPPTFQLRDWSFFFRYVIQVSDSRTQAILVKMRHLENMGIRDAIKNSKMKAEIKNEYESLVKIRNIFVNQTDKFSTIRHLAFYEDISAIVMEEADIQTLKSYFESPQMWIFGKARETFATYMELTGHWLRLFHDQFSNVTEGPFFKEAFHLSAKENLEKIEADAGKIDLSFARDLLDKLYVKYSQESLPYRTIHDNFSAANVFVTSDGRICSFDPHNKLGPTYLDLAKLIIDLETCKIQVLTNGKSVPASQLNKFNQSLLSGYFQTDSVNEIALNLFRLLLTIEKWEENEDKFKQGTGKSKLLYSAITPQMRMFFLKHLQKQVYQQDYNL